MPNLSEHFTIEELTGTSKVDSSGRLLANNPGPTETLYLRLLCELLLEPIRTILGTPLLVTSGYRSTAVEIAVSGKDYGQHRRGQAADFIPINYDLDNAFLQIYATALPYDQLLLESYTKSDGTIVRWIHVSISPVFAAPRREALVTTDGGIRWAHYKPTSPKGGLT